MWLGLAISQDDVFSDTWTGTKSCFLQFLYIQSICVSKESRLKTGRVPHWLVSRYRVCPCLLFHFKWLLMCISSLLQLLSTLTSGTIRSEKVRFTDLIMWCLPKYIFLWREDNEQGFKSKCASRCGPNSREMEKHHVDKINLFNIFNVNWGHCVGWM